VNDTFMRGLTFRVSQWRTSRCLLYCAAGLALLYALASPFASSQNKIAASPASIRENGYFRADLGLFFVEEGRLDVYDGGLDSGTIWDNVRSNYVLLRDAEKELPRAGAPYYHEVFQLERGEWNRTERDFSQEPKRYLDFGPCDTRNQLDLPNDELAGLDSAMRSALPRGIKIKGAVQFWDRFTVIISSEMPKEAPPIYQPGAYSLRTVLLTPQKEGWQVADNRQVEQWAYYCGMRTFPTKLQDGEPATVLLLYSSVPQGSRVVSVCRQIRSFIIRQNTSPGATTN
jgi:hypothetical protein